MDPRQALESERARTTELVTDLEHDLAEIAASTAESPDDEHDAEGSTVGYERARVGALLAGAQQHLDEISDALRRIADGTYATCETCGASIGAERLEAIPTTRRCVACATATNSRDGD